MHIINVENADGGSSVFGCFVIALLCLFAWVVSGCGLVHDTALSLSTIQLPPDVLYSAEFYQTATPQDVREAVGGRSLAGESYTERSMGEYSNPFLGGKAVSRTVGIFIPNTYVSGYRFTPLDVALENTVNPEIIKVLLEAGALPGDATMERYISDSVNSEIIYLLLVYSPPVTRCESYNLFALRGRFDRLNALSKRFSDTGPNCLTQYNEATPFMDAVMYNKQTAVLYMLRHGADLEKTNAQGMRPLDLALSAGCAEIAVFLLDRGADCGREDPDGNSLLRTAVLEGRIKDDALLMRLALNTPISGAAGEGAMEAACRSGNVGLVKALLARGAVLRPGTIYRVPKDASGSVETIRFLKGQGVKVEIK